MIPFSFMKSVVQIKSLYLWYDAANYTAGSWVDKRNGFTATSSGSNQPSFQSNILNGYPVVRFDGVNDYLSNSSVPAFGAGGKTMFVVCKSSVTSGILIAIQLGSQVAPGNAFTITREVFVRCQTRTVDFSSVSLDSSFAIACASGDSTLTNAKFYKNGVNITASAFNNTGALNTQAGIVIGASSTVPANMWNGDIAEILVYNEVITDNDRLNITNFLKAKYNL